MKVLLVKKACVLILVAQFNGIFWLTYDISQIKKVLEKKKSSYKWRSYQENQASFTIKGFTDISTKLCCGCWYFCQVMLWMMRKDPDLSDNH